VIHSQYWDTLKIHIPKITCGRLNDHIVCISAQNHDALHDYLVQRKVE
jgi:hypothetical protein